MKEIILQIAGVKSEAEFYKKFPTQEAFFKAHPEANQIIAQYKQELEQNVSESPKEQMIGGPEELTEKMAMGGMIKRKDGSYSKRGLWDNIRANKGSGKKPTKQMLESAKKIQAEEMMYGGNVEEYANGGYTVRRSNDRKGKTHVVIGPNGTKKYFGDPKMGEKGKSKHGKEAFYARHAKNLKNNPYFRAYARATWADGGILPDVEQLMLAGQNVYEMGGIVEYPTKYFLGGLLDGNGPRVFPMGDQPEYKFMNTTYPEGGMIGGPYNGNDNFEYAMGGGINIKPSHKGMFTAWAKKHGMSVQEAANHVMANKDKYDAHTVQMANFAKNAAGWKKAMGGFLYEDGGQMNVNIGNNVPVQTETYQGQPEQVVLPDGTIESVDAKTAHENMADDTVTDVLPSGSHIQSSRNKLTPAQYQQLIDMFTPEVAKKRMKQIEEVTKGKNKKISPAEISEYAKNKYQTKSTPNSFDTDKLKEGNKKSYIDLSIQMNDLIKAGKELAEGVLPQDIMAYGGMIPKYDNGTGFTGVNPIADEYEELMKAGYIKYDPKIKKIRANLPKDMPYKEKIRLGQAIEQMGLQNIRQSKTPGYDNFYGGNTPYDYARFFVENTKGIPYNDNVTEKQVVKDYFDLLGTPVSEEDLKNPASLFNLPGFNKAYQDYVKQTPGMRESFGVPTLGDTPNILGIQQWKARPLKVKATTETPVTVEETPGQKAENIVLENVNLIPGAKQVPMQNRFNYGLLESQLNKGLGANQAYVNALMGLNPVYTMETPDTYIRSMKTEVPVGNILYNIEKAQRNAANALANETGDWSTLAGNIANAGANAYNQIGDTLSALNEKNIGLYNQQQALEQGLLENNMDVRNQNLTNMQNMLNYKRNLLGKKSVRDAELFSEYAKSMGENSQKEKNQKLELMNIMAANPDMFKGEKGQMFANQILGSTGSFNNPFAGTLLDGIFSFR